MKISSTHKLDDLVSTLWSRTRQPAAGIAIVSKGEILYSRVLADGRMSEVVDDVSAPRFHIGSNSKAFNATLIAMLVDEGRLDWDRPVIEYVPEFGMIDAEVTRRCTLRDMVSMRTGLPRHDMAWVGRHFTRADLLAALPFLPLSERFRSKFQYNNIMVTIAGHIAERVAGESWEQLVWSRIFAPLGMYHSACDPSWETVQPFHESHLGALTPTSRVCAAVAAPTGGTLVSTLPDMAKWAGFHLSNGVVNQSRLVSEGGIQELYRPRIGIGGDASGPYNSSTCYGLGWFVDCYSGYRRISHGGYIHDINSHLGLFPELDLAIVNYNTFGSTNIAPFIAQEIFDAMLQRKIGIGVEHGLQQHARSVQQLRNERPALARSSGVPLPKSGLEGLFTHPGYGSIRITSTDQGLSLRLNDELEGAFVPFEGNLWNAAEQEFSLKWPDPFRWPCQIEFTHDREAPAIARTLKIRLEPAVDAIVFRHKP